MYLEFGLRYLQLGQSDQAIEKIDYAIEVLRQIQQDVPGGCTQMMNKLRSRRNIMETIERMSKEWGVTVSECIDELRAQHRDTVYLNFNQWLETLMSEMSKHRRTCPRPRCPQYSCNINSCAVYIVGLIIVVTVIVILCLFLK